VFWRTSRKDRDVKADLGGSWTGPLLADVSTFAPNVQTLLINQGDTLGWSLRDTPRDLLVAASDVTTYQTGSMMAGGGNGFMNTATGPVLARGPVRATASSLGTCVSTRI
jgi:hypothetical protein